MRSSSQRRNQLEKNDFVDDREEEEIENLEVHAQDSPDEYVKDYSSDADEMKMPKKRMRKKGRKAKFLVDQMLLDQQVQAQQNMFLNQQHQMQMYQMYYAPMQDVCTNTIPQNSTKFISFCSFCSFSYSSAWLLSMS